MDEKFKDKKVKIVVSEPSGAIRQLIVETLKFFGYKNVQGLSSIKDLIGAVEVDPIDWVITNSYEDQETKAINLLKLVTETPSLKHIKTTVILDEKEASSLPICYELGLFFHLIKPFNKESIKQFFEDFEKNMEENKFNTAQVSAEYLRDHLVSQKNYAEQCHLERSLLKHFPGDLKVLKNLAIAQFNQGKNEESMLTLKQMLIIDPDHSKQLEEFGKKIFGEDFEIDKIKPSENSVNTLNVKSCVIIDSDDAARKTTTDILKQLGIQEFHEFQDGKEAWEHIEKQNSIDLIIQEWKVPKVSGPQLIQRIHQKLPTTPVIIISSLITDEDAPLLQEVGIDSVLTKPIDKAALSKQIVSVIQQDRVPTSADAMANKIQALLEANQYEEALIIKQKLIDNTEVPDLYKKKALAFFAFADKNYIQARDYAVIVIKGQSQSIAMLNFIGKCFMKLGDHHAALRCLDKAQQMSPMNIQRLCDIAESSSEAGMHDKAKATLEAAKKADDGSVKVKEAAAKVHLNAGEVSEAKEAMQNLGTLSNIIAYMNNKAVACALSGKVEESMAIYQKTIDSLPRDRKEQKAIITYNLALAHVRSQDLTKAKDNLKMSLVLGNFKVTQKIKSLLNKVKKAMDSNTELHLNSGSPPANGQAEQGKGKGKKEDLNVVDHDSILNAMEANPGDICCFKIYTVSSEISEEINKVLEQKVRFKPRKAIQKEISSGIEKIQQRGA